MHAEGPGWFLAWASEQAKLARPGPALYRLVRPSLKKKQNKNKKHVNPFYFDIWPNKSFFNVKKFQKHLWALLNLFGSPMYCF